VSVAWQNKVSQIVVSLCEGDMQFRPDMHGSEKASGCIIERMFRQGIKQPLMLPLWQGSSLEAVDGMG